jgi:hypothetical protein
VRVQVHADLHEVKSFTENVFIDGIRSMLYYMARHMHMHVTGIAVHYFRNWHYHNSHYINESIGYGSDNVVRMQ